MEMDWKEKVLNLKKSSIVSNLGRRMDIQQEINIITFRIFIKEERLWLANQLTNQNRTTGEYLSKTYTNNKMEAP